MTVDVCSCSIIVQNDRAHNSKSHVVCKFMHGAFFRYCGLLWDVFVFKGKSTYVHVYAYILEVDGLFTQDSTCVRIIVIIRVFSIIRRRINLFHCDAQNPGCDCL